MERVENVRVRRKNTKGNRIQYTDCDIKKEYYFACIHEPNERACEHAISTVVGVPAELSTKL